MCVYVCYMCVFAYVGVGEGGGTGLEAVHVSASMI